MYEKLRTNPIVLKLISGNWSPREAHSHLPEIVDYAYALEHSLNRPVVKAVKNVGFDQFSKSLEEYIPSLKKPLGEYPAQLLGSIELSLDELVLIY